MSDQQRTRPKKLQTSIRISPEGRRLLIALADKLGISQASVIELAVRRLAKEEDIK